MIILEHHSDSKNNIARLKEDHIELPLGTTMDHIIYLACRFPDQWIGWTNKPRTPLEWNNLIEKATVHFMVLSKGKAPQFLSSDIDYVEDSPFINYQPNQWYPTWIMSVDQGMIHASIFQENIKWKSSGNFEYDLNLFTKLVQPQGAFCYSQLIPPQTNNHSNLIYYFVAQSYKKGWILFLLLCHLWYEKRFPFFAFAKACFKKRIYNTIDMLHIQKSTSCRSLSTNYDVVIPTMGRASYLKDVLLDMASQSILPQKVVIIEQDADVNSQSELNYLKTEQWPFEIIHEFIHQTGACNARNMALSYTSSDWVLFFDDDVRVTSDFATSFIDSLKETNSLVITFACLQAGEIEHQKSYKQWPYFGSGCSIVHKDVLQHCKFDMALEHGYGEDVDFGMQIRYAGYDIIYAPQIQMLHLKAPVGGFRKSHVFPWQKEEVQPKPSPQIMYFRKKNYSDLQLQGYKMLLFLKFYKHSGIKNPVKYFHFYKKAWNLSVKHASQLNALR